MRLYVDIQKTLPGRLDLVNSFVMPMVITRW
jgi:hypothetical protein